MVRLQGLETDEEEDPDAYLMECWPDDPADIGLESVLKTIGPLFEQRLYPEGTKLARQGDPANCIYFIEEGSVMVLHTMIKTDVESDEEEEEEVCFAANSVPSSSTPFLQQMEDLDHAPVNNEAST